MMQGLRIFGYVTVVALVFLSAAAGHSALVWDPAAEYSGLVNPNGVWSYRYETLWGGEILDGPLVRKENALSVDGYEWTHPTGDGAHIWRLRPDNGQPYTGVQPGELSLHPGWRPSYAVLRWTSPVSGTVTISGFFGAGNSASERYLIRKNGVPIFDQGPTGESRSFDLTENVGVGTTIDFMAGLEYVSGDTPLHATISSPVPLPATMLLLLPGLVIAAGSRRWRGSRL